MIHIHILHTLTEEYFHLASKFPEHFHQFRILLLVLDVNNCFILLQSKPPRNERGRLYISESYGRADASLFPMSIM